jgi:predicted dehydrogenase
MARIDIGIIGCGNISHSYLKGAARSELVRVRAVADVRMQAAHQKAAEYGVQALTVDQLLADPDIQIIINLTVPLAHAPVSLQIIDAAKHVYSEKPLVTRHAEAEALMLAAAAKGVRVGCAPDTFLGAGHQACRRAIDAGRIGRPIAGTAFFATHGMEHWHPNPEFFFKRGGGPMLDIGPYYVTQLVNLFGPVTRVAAQTTMGSATRTVTSDPLKGSIIEVEVPTTINGVLSFANGASVTVTTSWDVWKHTGLKAACWCPIPIFLAASRWSQNAMAIGRRSTSPHTRSASPIAASITGPRSLIIALLACLTWPRPFLLTAGTGPAASWLCTCWRCWTRSSDLPSKAVT